jgi:hypothetical protein
LFAAPITYDNVSGEPLNLAAVEDDGPRATVSFNDGLDQQQKKLPFRAAFLSSLIRFGP